MIKRFLIAAILVALFLGGVGYFDLVFKPQMVAGFMAKMVAPPATVTAERAGTKEWIDRVHSIGTLTAIRGVEVAPEPLAEVGVRGGDTGPAPARGRGAVRPPAHVQLGLPQRQ